MLKIGNLTISDYPLFLAPMEDISGPSFRSIAKSFGADVVVTEFISSEGLIRNAEKSLRKLKISDEERPVGIQIFGNNVNSMVEAAKVAESVNPDFIDINAGCPVKKVVSKGGGAALLKDIPLLLNICSSVVKNVKLPVTLKTRLGWDEKSIIIHDIAEAIQDTGISALTVHARTRSQLYGGSANWEWFRKIKENKRFKIPLIGNGDVDSHLKAKILFYDYGVDAVMIGRAALGYPFIFREIKNYLLYNQEPSQPSIVERIETLKKHIILSIQEKGERRGLIEMRLFYSGYFKNIPNFKPWKMKLMEKTSLDEIFKTFEEILQCYSHFVIN